ncbi:hypothetical protein Glove_243g78 [Diversispora epigaea]|uniref:Uncharacterized protein n=1 Tax=Diversispora epigaea TaxID=1348612 RepID=A0A397I9I6_9GLOM|nr:hypothetical protein Glove_243g78 [Diversispora epigaea]
MDCTGSMTKYIQGAKDYFGLHNDFKSYLYNNVPAKGGGDTPEDVLGGLDEAITKMTWKNDYRIILHVCDAPPRSSLYQLI